MRFVFVLCFLLNYNFGYSQEEFCPSPVGGSHSLKINTSCSLPGEDDTPSKRSEWFSSSFRVVKKNNNMTLNNLSTFDVSVKLSYMIECLTSSIKPRQINLEFDLKPQEERPIFFATSCLFDKVREIWPGYEGTFGLFHISLISNESTVFGYLKITRNS